MDEGLLAALRQAERRLELLREQRAAVVDASRDDNADDEHDPEGTTIAYEREQLTALIAQAERTRDELHAAATAMREGRYGQCERCGRAIHPERLQARPGARTCVGCA